MNQTKNTVQAEAYYVPYHTTTDLEPAAGWYFPSPSRDDIVLPVGPFDTQQLAEEAFARKSTTAR